MIESIKDIACVNEVKVLHILVMKELNCLWGMVAYLAVIHIFLEQFSFQWGSQLACTFRERGDV